MKKRAKLTPHNIITRCRAGTTPRFVQDRAAVATTAVLQIVRGALMAWLHCDHADMAGARAAVEALLRDEFDDVARTTINEIRREDG